MERRRPTPSPMNSSTIATVGSLVLLTSLCGGLAYWASFLRPYLHRKGITRITAPSWAISALSDWQMCSDHARKDGDQNAAWVARGFTIFLFGQILGLALIVFGIVERQGKEPAVPLPAQRAPALNPQNAP